jgi:hypothetical protein
VNFVFHLLILQFCGQNCGREDRRIIQLCWNRVHSLGAVEAIAGLSSPSQCYRVCVPQAAVGIATLALNHRANVVASLLLSCSCLCHTTYAVL